MEVPSSSVHHTTSESMNPEGLYPWELEWESQKLYKFEPWKKIPKQEEFEDELSTDSPLSDVIKSEVIEKTETTDTEEVIVEEEEEENTEDNKEKEVSVVDDVDDDEEQEKVEDKIKVGSETMNFMTEKDLNDFDDSQEGETCLHIHTGDEEEKEDEENTKEDEEEEEDEEVEKRESRESHLVTKFDSNNISRASEPYAADEQHSVARVPKMSCSNLSDSDSVEEKDRREDEKVEDSEQEEEELVICDGEVASSSLNNSPVNSDAATPASPSRASVLNCGENVVPANYSEHLCDNLRLTSDASKPLKYATLDIPSNNLCKPVHQSLPVKTLGDKIDKDKRRERVDRVDRVDRDKKKSDRTKVKERGKDREKEDRPPKKLKIKFKSEERALVPPLRIRTEERGLKLTLKKQEGSGAYYSVGEDRKREYRVEQNEDEEDEEELGDHIIPPFEAEEGNEEGEGHGSSLKEVKVVLQDVLKDKRFKKQVEEKSSKKRRKEKCDERTEKNEKNDSSYNPNNSHWSNYSQQMHQNDGDKKFSQTNQDSRTWNCNPGEWRKSGGEGASNVDHSSDHKARDYSSHLYSYSEHYGHENSGHPIGAVTTKKEDVAWCLTQRQQSSLNTVIPWPPQTQTTTLGKAVKVCFSLWEWKVVGEQNGVQTQELMERLSYDSVSDLRPLEESLSLICVAGDWNAAPRDTADTHRFFT
ncbi:hypothetical protein GWK47_021578 [Chionoecetes opilio]|uniref:Uncharacterized protein n=1 Tax=Chionoecetes opilio TaxID=41210 RepID=A0A8J4XPC8_CHIOP|nr:hypothetical protein GWK47_021578 [Chionoecetes opilio]